MATKYIGHSTPKGVKVELKQLYVYPDGHANLVFKDNQEGHGNWPMADALEFAEHMLYLYRTLVKQARDEQKERDRVLPIMLTGSGPKATTTP
jgi:hypothetical protein